MSPQRRRDDYQNILNLWYQVQDVSMPSSIHTLIVFELAVGEPWVEMAIHMGGGDDQ